MAHINLHRLPGGWRATIEKWGHSIVVDGFFKDELEATRAALATSRRIQL